MPLTTLDKVKANLGITDTASDVQLTAAINTANALIAGYLGADLSDATTDRVYTVVVAPGTDYLNLPVFPALSVTGITVNADPVDPATYELVERTGTVDFFTSVQASGPRPNCRVTVTYKAGFAADAIPADLAMVCENIAAAVFNDGGSFASSMNGGRGELKSMTMFDAMSMSFETNAGASADSAGTPEGMLKAWAYILDQYSVKGKVLK